nr:HD domain-containing phosphohydrolase [Pseudodesulfovibrio sp.]
MQDATATGIESNESQKISANNVFKVSPYMVIPSRVGGFSLYLKQDKNFVLYAEKGVLFTEEHTKRLIMLDVKHLYVKASDYAFYTSYLQDNIMEVLEDEAIPLSERARAWNDATVAIAKSAFDRSLPAPVDKRQFKRIKSLISNSLTFLTRDDALRELSRFIREGDSLYRHGIAVMVLTIVTLATFMKDEHDILVAVGLGAMLHDIGKLELPQNIFVNRYETLNREGKDLVRSHPALGVGYCSSLPLPQETLQCILFHHEREDGTGYPSGSTGNFLPDYVKVLTMCNLYDNLVTGKYGRKKTPFEALTHIRSMRSAFDQKMLKRLISVLATSDLA